jgi:hypothetical protein
MKQKSKTDWEDWIFIIALFSVLISLPLGLVLIFTVNVWCFFIFFISPFLFFVVWMPLAQRNWNKRTKMPKTKKKVETRVY